MKLTRFISGIILFVAFFVLLVFGNSSLVNVVAAIAGVIAINEYCNSFKGKYKVDRYIGSVLAIFIAFMNIIPKEMLIILIPITILLLFVKVIITKMETNFVDIAITGFGIIYVIGFLAFIPLIYGGENGKYLIWYLAIAAWGTDTFAYLIGCKFGKHKLTTISPKKSIEGSIAGIIGAVAVNLIYTYCINQFAGLGISYLAILGITVILSILSQIGDLSASSIKRFTGIKDFGNLIPGHGGILDRIDSIIFIAPFAYYLLMLI